MVGTLAVGEVEWEFAWEWTRQRGVGRRLAVRAEDRTSTAAPELNSIVEFRGESLHRADRFWEGSLTLVRHGWVVTLAALMVGLGPSLVSWRILLKV